MEVSKRELPEKPCLKTMNIRRRNPMQTSVTDTTESKMAVIFEVTTAAFAEDWSLNGCDALPLGASCEHFKGLQCFLSLSSR